ncbi:MAG: nucleotidyltransferase [Chitinophagales bacterium]|nr:nucleotidyltransferase [Chitinophagales bacterium]
MDIFDEAILAFWKNLNDNKVKYIMIGGFAVNLHGFNRTTADIDIWIENTTENRLALGKVFNQYNYTDIDWTTIDLIPGWTNFYIGNNIDIDIIVEMKGLEQYTFEECLQMASVAEILAVKVPFLHINQLIENKKTTNRPKDKIDIIELEKIKKIRDEN